MQNDLTHLLQYTGPLDAALAALLLAALGGGAALGWLRARGGSAPAPLWLLGPAALMVFAALRWGLGARGLSLESASAQGLDVFYLYGQQAERLSAGLLASALAALWSAALPAECVWREARGVTRKPAGASVMVWGCSILVGLLFASRLSQLPFDVALGGALLALCWGGLLAALLVARRRGQQPEATDLGLSIALAALLQLGLLGAMFGLTAEHALRELPLDELLTVDDALCAMIFSVGICALAWLAALLHNARAARIIPRRAAVLVASLLLCAAPLVALCWGASASRSAMDALPRPPQRAPIEPPNLFGFNELLSPAEVWRGHEHAGGQTPWRRRLASTINLLHLLLGSDLHAPALLGVVERMHRSKPLPAQRPLHDGSWQTDDDDKALLVWRPSIASPYALFTISHIIVGDLLISHGQLGLVNDASSLNEPVAVWEQHEYMQRESYARCQQVGASRCIRLHFLPDNLLTRITLDGALAPEPLRRSLYDSLPVQLTALRDSNDCDYEQYYADSEQEGRGPDMLPGMLLVELEVSSRGQVSEVAIQTSPKIGGKLTRNFKQCLNAAFMKMNLSSYEGPPLKIQVLHRTQF